MKAYLSLLLVLVCCLTKSFAQDKYEKESRIKKAQVPVTALNFIEAADFSQKIKWYKEESLVRYKFNEKNKLETGFDYRRSAFINNTANNEFLLSLNCI